MPVNSAVRSTPGAMASKPSTRILRWRPHSTSPRTSSSDAKSAGQASRASLFRMLDKRRMRREANAHMQDLKIGINSMGQAVETLSGGQRQGVAVARSAAFARHVVIMDEPTAALGVKESHMVLDLIRQVRDRGLPVILISHNMPQVFEVADRVHIQRLGKRVAVIEPRNFKMSDAVAIMTGAMVGERVERN